MRAHALRSSCSRDGEDVQRWSVFSQMQVAE